MAAVRVLVVVVCFVLVVAGAWADEFDSIVDERLAAHDRMMAGELWEGATDLINSLRALPLDKPEAADAAIGSMQLMLFTVEYLMDGPTWDRFATEVLDPNQYPIDDYLHFLFQINDDRGITQETMNEVVRRFYEFSHSGHPFVKIGALAIMANPYYFRDSKLGQDACDRMAAEFPDLAITEEALRQALYVYRDEETELEEELEPDVPEKALSVREESPARAFLATDPLTTRMRATIRQLHTPETQTETVAAMCLDARTDPDWRMRYGLLQMVEPYRNKGDADAVKGLLENLAGREEATPEVTRAQSLLIHIAQGEGNTEAAERYLAELLSQQRRIDVLERNLYEVVMQTTLAYAGGQAQRGDIAGATAALNLLAAKYPKSGLAVRCTLKATELSEAPATVGETESE